MFQETPAEAWKKRFGQEPPEGMPDLGRLLNHRSVRQYSGEPVPEGVVRGLIGAAQSAATSSNLQLWSVVSVQDRATRERIAEKAENYRHIVECAWFLCFLADLNRIRAAATSAGEAADGLDYVEFEVMAVIDAALAAERLVCAAESIGLGTCYIGALRNDVRAVQEILGLPKGVFGVFGLCVGWPAEDATAEIRPRLRAEQVWFRERYPSGHDFSEYDERMRPFYIEQGMKGEVTWSMRSARRVNGSSKSMTGRDALKPWLEEQGMGLR
jgi:nitroreductase